VLLWPSRRRDTAAVLARGSGHRNRRSRRSLARSRSPLFQGAGPSRRSLYPPLRRDYRALGADVLPTSGGPRGGFSAAKRLTWCRIARTQKYMCTPDCTVRLFTDVRRNSSEVRVRRISRPLGSGLPRCVGGHEQPRGTFWCSGGRMSACFRAVLTLAAFTKGDPA
jgi:hypothetical protein